MSAMRYFEEVGQQVERSWADVRGSEDSFPEVAEKVLREVDAPSDLDAAGLLGAVVDTPALPEQQDRKGVFGQPPVTVYQGTNFYIAVLFWFDGTTTIHEHSFSGALRVLQGSSIHVGYRFETTELVNRRLRFGTLSTKFAEVLRLGDVRPIHASGEGAHSLFHLDRPSVTMVVRTYLEPWAQPQLDYLRPGLAFDPFYRNDDLDLRYRAIAALREVDAEGALSSAMKLVDRLDILSGLTLLQRWSAAGDRRTFSELLQRFTERHGSVGVDLQAVFEHQQQDVALALRRRMLRDPRHRIFLAILMNLPEAEPRRSALAALFPGEDGGKVMAELVLELSGPELRGASGLHLRDADREALEAALASGGDPDRVLADLRATVRADRPGDIASRLFA
jgi:hypothetical protein